MSIRFRLPAFLSLFSLLVLSLLIITVTSSDLPAQGQGKKSGQKEEEEEPQKKDKQSTKKNDKEEEEEPAKPKRRVPLRVGDEDTEEKQSRPAAKPGGAWQAKDLKEEAERTKNSLVAELFRTLATPHDDVLWPSSKLSSVAPIAQFVGPKPDFAGELTVRPFDADWKLGRSFSVTRKDIQGVNPYENIVQTKVQEFIQKVEKEPEGSARHLARLEMLQEAEKPLIAAMQFHESAVEQGLRTGAAWSGPEKTLRAKLQSVQLDQLRALTSAKDWNSAFELATRLNENYRKDKDVQLEIARLLAVHAEHAIAAKDYAEVRKRLLVLEDLFPNSPNIEPVREQLRKQAAAIVDQARELDKNGQAKEAISVLQTAESIYPQLPGLHDYNLRLNKKYPIIYVGVRELPELMSPAAAITDSEKQAVEFLFESLVKLKYTPSSGQKYERGLSVDLPGLVPLGRSFQLVRNLSWSNGAPLLATDVRRTVSLLSDPKFPGRMPDWAELMNEGEGARVEGSAFRISLTLKQGVLDPLAMMDFKVLPGVLPRANDPDFAHNPVGSGPYKLDREKSKAGESVAFTANPYYESRPGKSGLPHIREIHFVVSNTPPADFQAGRLQLLLDLPTRRYKELETTPDVTVQTLRNRRIWFLAVNHRRGALKNQALRRAIAHAIDREKILTEKFREGHATFHRPLNGPYPPYAWAAKPGLPPDPFNLTLAAAQAQHAKLERALPGRLTLKYPEGDTAVKEACELICKQAKEVGVEIQPVGRSPRDLHREVEELHDYDLAYYCWDYADESYRLHPLFDNHATQAGGRNYMGYQNDGVLAGFFQKTMNRRDITEIQKLTQMIHEHLYETMPLIPLWQLDTHYAFHNSLRIDERPDPLLFFTGVEKWSLDKK